MKVLKFLFSVIDAIRRVVLNVIFLAVVILLLAVIYMSHSSVSLDKGTLLQMNLAGDVSETLQEDSQEFPLSFFMDDVSEGVRIRDVVSALSKAAKDEAIAGVVLNVDGLGRVGMAGVREIANAIDQYRAESGRQVWVWSASYTQSQYLIAAHADHVALHPMGQAMLKGLSSSSLYWGNFLRNLGIGVDVHKAGAFKSAPEVFTNGEPSAQALAAQKSYLDAAWTEMTGALEKRRGLMPGTIQSFILSLPQKVSQNRSLSEIFKEADLVDELQTHDAFEKTLAERYTATQKVEDLKGIDYRDYLSLFDQPYQLASPGVAVINLEGEIGGDDTMAGITPERFTRLIEGVEDDANTKALVVRLNSPGGDALASEMIRARLARVAQKMPVIVSMGDVAASGGYWISTAANRIVADPLTVTGSIGVFAMTFDAKKLRGMWQVGRGGYQTTPLADFGRLTSEPSPFADALIDAGVMRTYNDFKRLVEQGRKMTPTQVESIAQGRVWLGLQAKEVNLVDALGNTADAVKIAGQMAGLPENAPVLSYEYAPAGWRTMLGRLLNKPLIFSITDEPVETQIRRYGARVFVTGRPLVLAPFEPVL